MRELEMIRKYNMEIVNGVNLKCCRTPNNEDLEFLKENKQNIINYINNMDSKKEEKINSIEGLKILEKAIIEENKIKSILDYNMYTGEYRPIPQKEYNLDELYKKYKNAKFFLKLKEEIFSNNYELSKIAENLLDEFYYTEKTIEQIEEKYNRSINNFVEKHIWN